MGTGYATVSGMAPPVPVESLAARLGNHSSRLAVALSLANDILSLAKDEQSSPEPSGAGASGWMMRAAAQIEELISDLERIKTEVGCI